MVRNKDGDGIKSSSIVSEVQKRPCLYDTNHINYGDRAEKIRSWEEVCESVVPGWQALGLTEKFAAGRLPGQLGEVMSQASACGVTALYQPVGLQLSRSTCVLFVRSDAFEMYPVRNNVCANLRTSVCIQ
ncbi:unnamed protein product, partial [Brenthis ino]